jgi:hypothetical protein
VEQAPVFSAAGGAGKQSEAILERRFLSSPILSLQEKERMGKRKKRILCAGFVLTQENADAALGPVSFLCLARKILDRKNRLRSLKAR